MTQATTRPRIPLHECTHVVIDIETMGTLAHAPIVSIGAAAFNSEDIRNRNFNFLEFYRRIEWKQYARQISDQSTLDTAWWWFDADPVALREVVSTDRIPLKSALCDLGEFITTLRGTGHPSEDPGLRVWGNGPSFDCRILADAFVRCGLGCPWHFWEERCLRTQLDNFRAPPEDVTGNDLVKHHAMDDARLEARQLVSRLWIGNSAKENSHA